MLSKLWNAIRRNSPAKQKYVLGFLFNTNFDTVVLIRKNRPVWQAGKLNGVGGKVEPGETYKEAMVREFCEETGVSFDQWHSFCALHYETADIQCYWGSSDLCWKATSATDEVVSRFEVSELTGKAVGRQLAVPHIQWLLPMCVSLSEVHPTFYDIREVANG